MTKELPKCACKSPSCQGKNCDCPLHWATHKEYLKSKTPMTKTCNNPEPEAEYSKDELGDIHFYCRHCGKEVMEIRTDAGEDFEYHHAHRGLVIDD